MNTKNPESMIQVFQERVKQYGNEPCVSFLHKGKYKDLSWNDMNSIIRRFSMYLLGIGINNNSRVGLFSENRFEWWVVDQAVQAIGAIVVPLYSTNSAEEAEYILSRSGATVCVVSGQDQLDKTISVKNNLPELKTIIAFDNPDKLTKDVVLFEKALATGEKAPNQERFEQRIDSIKSDNVATIIFTSGTTAEPKGVVLTHRNYFSNVKNTIADIAELITHDDIFLSFLPLSHVLERTVGYYVPVYCGSRVVFAQGMETLMDDFKQVRPTIIISVPRVYEKIHAGILSKLVTASPLKKVIFNFAVKTARKNLPYVCKSTVPGGIMGLRLRVADKLIFSKLLNAIGFDRLKFAVSGGGPLSQTDAEFFLGMGVTILEGYGLTETSPITHYNRPGDIKVGSVGRAVRETQVRIDDDGEILVKGPQVMKGYYKDTKGTQEVMTEDGFLMTGDLGILDNEGRLIITGRKKDIIVTSGGKNISPQRIENSVKQSHYVEQIGVVGDRRKFISALVIPAFGELETWAKNNKITFKSRKELIQNNTVVELYMKEIARLTRYLGQVEKIKKFAILEDEWTQETGELTPKQSVKRRVIEEKYSDIIDSLYSDN